MMLWVILTFMVTGAALFLAEPLLREGAVAAGASDGEGANVFREQLAEVDRELAEGTINAAQADAARLEIKRRVLSLQHAQDVPVRRLARIERRFLAWVAAAVVAIGATLVYSLNGRPDVPAAPRGATAAFDSRTVPGVPSGGGGSAPAAQAQSSQAQSSQAPATALASVDDMIDRLSQRMAANPNDADGWRMLGWSYFRTDRYQEAASAYGKAAALQPEVGAVKTMWAEALVRAADGKVTAQALRLSEEALLRDAKDPRARYFVGLAKEQAGDANGALELWIALLGDATPADDWAADVRQQTVALAGARGIDIAARLPMPSSGPGVLGKLNQAATPAPALPHSATIPGGRGPTEAEVRAAEYLSQVERDTMIRGMVDGLQAKLDANPRDADGWIKLVRSRAVLGETDKVRAALARVAQVFNDAPAERDRVIAAAREAGIAP